MFDDLWTLLQEVISYVFVIKIFHINACPILDGYGFLVFFNSRTRPRVNRVLLNQLAGDVLRLVAYRVRCKHYFCHLTGAVRQAVLRPEVAFSKTSFKHR